jgi:RimJ/RimL family protein N-acetyltransferase
MQIELAPDPEFPFPDGVRLRILGRDDISLLVEHVLSLDAEGLRDRFNGSPSREWIEDCARRCISPGTLVIAAEREGRVIGVAELHPVRPETAELAFSVLSPWRGKGVGAALFSLIVEAAWSRGLDSIQITTHSSNDAMKRLARRFGTEMRFEQGETVGRIALDEIHMLDRSGGQRSWIDERSGRKGATRRR